MLDRTETKKEREYNVYHLICDLCGKPFIHAHSIDYDHLCKKCYEKMHPVFLDKYHPQDQVKKLREKYNNILKELNKTKDGRSSLAVTNFKEEIK